jgi:hypothetical protein
MRLIIFYVPLLLVGQITFVKALVAIPLTSVIV